MVELALFNKLPHLLCPVLTNPKKVSAALNWVVEEMERRYKLFARAGARNIEAFNQKSEKEKLEEDMPGKLPFIIIVIDELADLMAIASHEIENAEVKEPDDFKIRNNCNADRKCFAGFLCT